MTIYPGSSSYYRKFQIKINFESAEISNLDPSTITINATTIFAIIRISHVFSLAINHACLRIHIKRRTIDDLKPYEGIPTIEGDEQYLQNYSTAQAGENELYELNPMSKHQKPCRE